MNNVEVSWRKATIPKKSGGVRELTIPNDALKKVQTDVMYYMYALTAAGIVKVSACAHGFLPGRNTMSSMLKHQRNPRCFVCTDMKDFFTNCKQEYLEAVLLDACVAPPYVKGVLRCCAYEGGFPQGSPASPMLTNIIMFNADNMIASYAKANGFVYTRYADDLVFSLETVTPETEAMLQRTKEEGSHNPFVPFLYGVEKILTETLELKLNHKKDHIIFNKSVTPQNILGITIRQDGHGYNADRTLRRNARAATCNLFHKVFDLQNGEILDEDKHTWSVTKGMVTYCNNVRKESDPEEKYSGFDPMIQQELYKPLEVHFAAARELRQVAGQGA